ncbi:hypothetical protein IQ277_28135 [Nostocales cyanobacterium LEGE 12452]|nr:hypothetical protein [Nostocales cyanobacterium LEGE 12452]
MTKKVFGAILPPHPAPNPILQPRPNGAWSEIEEQAPLQEEKFSRMHSSVACLFVKTPPMATA